MRVRSPPLFVWLRPLVSASALSTPPQQGKSPTFGLYGSLSFCYAVVNFMR